MITPFLTLVLAGFALFMLVLGFVWIRNFADDIRVARHAATAKAPAKAASASASHETRRAA